MSIRLPVGLARGNREHVLGFALKELLAKGSARLSERAAANAVSIRRRAGTDLPYRDDFPSAEFIPRHRPKWPMPRSVLRSRTRR